MTVRMCLFISSGEIIRQDRVFLISCPNSNFESETIIDASDAENSHVKFSSSSY